MSDDYPHEAIEAARKRYEKRIAKIGPIDYHAIMEAWDEAKRRHMTHDLVATVPTDLYDRLVAEVKARADYHAEVDKLFEPQPAMPYGSVTMEHATLFGCRVVVADTDSGQVEFRPEDTR